MSATIWIFVSLGAGFFTGIIGFYIYRQTLDTKIRRGAEDEASRILSKAKSESSRIERDSHKKAKDFEQRARRNVETEMRKEKQKAQNLEKNYQEKNDRLSDDYKRKEDQLKKRMKGVEERGERLRIQEQRMSDLEAKTNDSIQELRQKLEEVAGYTEDQAREELKKAVVDEAQKEAAIALQQIEDEAKSEANKRARKVIAVALSRYASEVSTEKTVTSLPLRGDEMKGKIIGREGRNIRALEAACGVDLIVDETPETVVISCFDPVRREVARLALEKLMDDGRVHPGRIEEVVEKAKQELYKKIKEDGEKVAFDLGLSGIHPNILKLIGSMRYRLSNSQNLLDHCMEVSYIAGIMAAEIGEDIQSARRAGLLHDLGKAIDHSIEGDAALVGAEYAKRHGEKDRIVHAIRSLGHKEEANSALAHIVVAANTFSESRPGANRDMVQNFIRRLVDLESIGNSFDGVVRTYALQSGKEVRVMVESGKITDDQAGMLVRDIARKIEREANYPGQVKVSVIRETRMVEHAR